MKPNVSPTGAAGLPGTPGASYDAAFKEGYQAGLQRGLAEARVDAALLDAYQRELAGVHHELTVERMTSSQLRNVLRGRS